MFKKNNNIGLQDAASALTTSVLSGESPYYCNKMTTQNSRHTEIDSLECLRQAIAAGYGYFMRDEDGTMYAYDGDYRDVNPNYVALEGDINDTFMGCPIEEAERLFFAE